MSYYFKYILSFFGLCFLIGCISVKDINKTYQKGNKAWVSDYEKNEDNIPLLSFGTEQENEDERIKVERFIDKTIDSLNISLNDLIIIKKSSGSQNENYYFFPKNGNSIYYFVNTIFFTDTLKIYEAKKNSFSDEVIHKVYNYFNTSDYKTKRLNMDFCTKYSSLHLSILKVENKKIELFYIDPIDMCKDNNAFKALQRNKIVRWKFDDIEKK